MLFHMPKLFQLSFEKTCSTTRSLFTRLEAECFAFAETGNRRLLAELEALFSVFISFKLSSNPWALHAVKCLCVRAMRDFVTYYCRW